VRAVAFAVHVAVGAILAAIAWRCRFHVPMITSLVATVPLIAAGYGRERRCARRPAIRFQRQNTAM
jgi:hypothetical protein